ncbi:MAG: hypothetical protein ACRDJK_03020 [Actinomycetota bacterium]
MDLHVVARALELIGHGLGMPFSLGLFAFSILWLTGHLVRRRERRPSHRSGILALLILSALFLSSGLAAGSSAQTAQTSKGPDLTCDSGDTGIWAPLSSSNHDNLVLVPERSRITPGDVVAFNLRWEWRDWRPGTALHIRACTDIDGQKEVDAKATPPHEGPQFDFDTTHPKEPPEVRAGEKDRRVVTHTITFRVPKDLAPGELCTRAAVTGKPEDHAGSSPKFDIAQTVCLPIAAPPPAPPTGPPPAPPTGPAAALSSPPAYLSKELPVTGGTDGRLVALALGLLGAGTVLELKANRARKVATHSLRA